MASSFCLIVFSVSFCLFKTSSFNQPSYSKKPPSVPERIQGRTASTRAVPPKFSINLGKPHAAGDAENDASIFWVTGGDRRNTGIPINGYDHKKGMWWSWYVMTMIIDWVWGTRFSPMQSGLFAGKPGRGSGQFSMCIRFSNWAYLIYLHIFTYIWTWRFSSISTYQYGNSPDPPRPPRLLETFLIGLPHGSHRTTSQHRDCTSWAGGDGRAGHHQKIQKQWRDE
jgi:hypothetical protein